MMGNRDMHNKPNSDPNRPVWVQIMQNALLLIFLLSAAVFVTGILRTGILFVGGHVVTPTVYFFGSVLAMIIAASSIVVIGNRWPAMRERSSKQ